MGITDEREADGREFSKLVDCAKGVGSGENRQGIRGHSLRFRANFNKAVSVGAEPVSK